MDLVRNNLKDCLTNFPAAHWLSFILQFIDQIDYLDQAIYERFHIRAVIFFSIRTKHYVVLQGQAI